MYIWHCHNFFPLVNFLRVRRWEDCQQLLISPNFFENLRFFDKDNVPKRKLHRLNKIISRHSKFEMLAQGSQAVISLCSWLNALIDYHNTKTAVQPFRESLAKAEKTLLDVRANTACIIILMPITLVFFP